MAQMVYRFSEGDASMSALLGGKGGNLCEMTRLGLPVPPGFVITTQVCRDYLARGYRLPEGLGDVVRQRVGELERAIGHRFGSAENPLLVSVRSGARVSMPGMMDTILNLGINDEIVEGLGAMMGDRRPAWDAYRRFVQIYAEVVQDAPPEPFEECLSAHKARAGVSLDYQLTAGQLQGVTADFKEIARQYAGAPPPGDPWEQLFGAVEAVFRSWHNPRAVVYRNQYGIDHDLGTAVTIMGMVYGNLGPTSGTGVLFTRDPATGRRPAPGETMYGEFLSNAQGEDVVAGVRTPEPLGALADLMPERSEELLRLAADLERHYRDVQDVEFTIERGRLYLLQTRSAKRTPLSAVKTAVDLAREGLITREEAIGRVDPEEITQLLVPQFAADLGPDELAERLLATGAGASPGAASGRVCFDADAAADLARRGERVILVRPETKPDDIHGIIAAAGVVTSRGGVTSHAAVVTRGLGKPCIVGCEGLQVAPDLGEMTGNGRTVREGERLSIDGGAGQVYAGQLATVNPGLEDLPEAKVLLGWADDARRLGVMANADTPADARQSLAMGAQGIGLCRTEHMFLDPNRLPAVRQMLLNAEAAAEWGRDGGGQGGVDIPEAVLRFREALGRVRRLQTDDFRGILRVMARRPVIIRLLDAPLHEFLPPYEELVSELAGLRAAGAAAGELAEKEAFLQRVDSLREVNPMLGHRGCRLGLSFPAIYRMQVEAIITAGAQLASEGLAVNPEIMIPLTVDAEEMRRLRADLAGVADETQRRMGAEVHYKFGTMIETPRAALTAGAVAGESEFFSFGTNDLTQMTYGFSRDDAEGKFLRNYINEGVLPGDPFASIDREGVGELIRWAVNAGREARPDLEIGICGEHGGDPRSVAFCHEAGLDYVSCSPFRVPVARLAAAQAALDGD